MPLFEPLVAEGILRKWLRGAPGHCSSLCNRFRGFSRRSLFLKLWGHRQVGCETSECMILSSCWGQQANFFSKMLTYKRAYSGVKLSLSARAPDRNHDSSCFPIGPKANWDRSCTRFLRLWSLLNFARGKGQQRPSHCQAHPPTTMFRYRVIRVRKSAALKIYTLPSRELLFSSCPHWHGFVVWEAVYKWWKFQSFPLEN